MKDNTIIGVLSYSKLIKRRNLPLSTRVGHIMSMPPKIKSCDNMAKVLKTKKYPVKIICESPLLEKDCLMLKQWYDSV